MCSRPVSYPCASDRSPVHCASASDRLPVSFTEKSAALLAPGAHHGDVLGDRSPRRLASPPTTLVHLRSAGHASRSLHLRLLHPDPAGEEGCDEGAVAIQGTVTVLRQWWEGLEEADQSGKVWGEDKEKRSGG